MRLFSKRHRQQPNRLIYDVPVLVRSRVLHTFKELLRHRPYGDFEGLLEDVEGILIREYGRLSVPSYAAARTSIPPVIEHFSRCEDEQALDFIEACFHSFQHSPRQEGVDAINQIFRDEGIGYELSRLVETEVEDDTPGPFPPNGGKRIQITYPQFIRLDNRHIHHEVVSPCLDVLSGSNFAVANEEILKAHMALRAGDWGDAITASAAAFESVLKTICRKKKWAFDHERDTCSRLVDICKEKGLFPPFYADPLKFTGTIRNKLSDAHGRGPKREYDASKELAEHMVHLTSSHILMLARRAEMA